MKSFSILRTNVGLTTNVKVVVDSKYNLYLESIDSVSGLDIDRLKKFQFNKNNFYDELVPYFFRNIPVDVAFEVKFDDDRTLMFNNFENQYDDIYQMGARNVSNNKDYSEEYEYFAPLYIFKQGIPNYFVIFRIDGSGLENLSRDNFRELFLEKFKTVKVFDLTKKTPLGEWVDVNFRKNKSFPTKSLDIDFRNLEFSRWFGIDYDSGGYTSKSRFMNDALEDENTLFDLEKSFYDGYRVNKLIYPQIINFNFLFDDTPATPNRLRKWSLNRYAGFYIDDMELVDRITPFNMKPLKSGFQILEGNVISHPDGDPFVRGFSDEDKNYIEFGGEFFVVEKFEEVQSKRMVNVRQNRKVAVEEYTQPTFVKYRIISDKDLTGGESLVNTKKFTVDGSLRILDQNLNPFQIEGFDLSDVHLIEIDGRYHNLISEDGYIKIVTDYGMNLKEDYRFEYFINSPDPNYYNYVDLQGDPISFNIWRLKFTDVKDFDLQIVDSKFSNFEYESSSSLTKTEEPKMYTPDLRSISNPPVLNDYIYNGQVENIPASSDYTANLETFRIINGDLSDLWRKNSIHCRWGYQNSLGSSDYPYLLNNNEIHGDYNRVANTKLLKPFRPTRNLDYFYSINSGSTSYKFHSLHVERNFGINQDISFRFELDKCLNTHTMSFDGDIYTYSLNYFDYLFDSEVDFLKGTIIQNSKKYSLFETGDDSEPNTTLFRGIKFKIFEVDSIKTSINSIDTINVKSSNYFEDWKFSILLSDNNLGIGDDNLVYNIGEWGYFIDNLYYDNQVSFFTSTQSAPDNIQVGDVVEIKQSPPYVNSQYNTKANVTHVGILGTYSGIAYYGFATDIPWGESTPANPGYWRVMTQWKNIQNWESNKLYQVGDIVLYDDVLYEVLQNNLILDPLQNPTSNSLSSVYGLYTGDSPFWSPGLSYSTDDWVYRDGNYWVRTGQSDSFIGNFWSPTFSYAINDVVIYKGEYYRSKINGAGISPRLSKGSIGITSGSFVKYWELIWQFNSPIWKKVEIWNPILSYGISTYIVHNDILYRSSSDTIGGIPPNESPDWERIYSFVPDTNFNYSTQSNPFLKINDSNYLCTFNRDFSLDNGITIYINKKWKNVLVNIAINDNTSFKIDNISRDEMYNILNSRLTAANFIRQVNNLSSKYGFVDYTSYVVIEEDGTFKKYKFGVNIEELPYIISCEEPDEIELNNNTIRYIPATLDINILKPINTLKNGNIDNLNKINNYNFIPLGCQIEKNLDRGENLINYNGLSNTGLGGVSNLSSRGNFSRSKPIYRHSGPYMPVFYDIDLFDRGICEFEDLFSIRYETETLEPIGNIDLNFNSGSGFDGGGAHKAVLDNVNNKFIINGDFTHYQGLTCGGVCKINLDGLPDIEFINNIGVGLTGGNKRGLCLQSDGKILVGGQFDYFNGLTYSRLIRLNVDGTVDSAFNENLPMFGGPSALYEILQQPDGKILVGGNWETYQGLTVSSGIIRLLSNGDPDPDFNIGTGMVGNSVYSIHLQNDSKIICGGIFATWSGYPVQGLVRLNSDGSFDTTFIPNSNLGVNGIVLAINQSSDGKIYLGGGFSQFSGITSSRIVRLNSDGSYDSSFISPFGASGLNSVESIHFQSNGKILLGGSQITNTTPPQTGFRLNLDGSIDSSFTASFSPINSGGSRSYLDNVGGVYFIGGGFTQVNGVTASRIVKFDVERNITQINEISECPKYKFNENLTFFGILKQRIISKINRKLNLLKLSNLENYDSIYPMLDEFGYTVSDFFIFKSTWDFQYYLETGKGISINSVGSLIQTPSVQTIPILTPSVDVSDTPPPITTTGGIFVAVSSSEVPGPIPNPSGPIIGSISGTLGSLGGGVIGPIISNPSGNQTIEPTQNDS
jgi:uncharacterized delta-60 repeat protein